MFTVNSNSSVDSIKSQSEFWEERERKGVDKLLQIFK